MPLSLEPVREWTVTGAEVVALGVGILAVVIIVAATAHALVLLVRALLAGRIREEVDVIRLSFARGVVLALEFLVAADVLRTVAAPSLNALLLVGGLVLLRTGLAFALEWEMSRMEGRASEAPSARVT